MQHLNQELINAGTVEVNAHISRIHEEGERHRERNRLLADERDR